MRRLFFPVFSRCASGISYISPLSFKARPRTVVSEAFSMVLGLGMQEVVLVLALLFIVFGPTKLPKIARELGKVVREFNKAASGLQEEINKASSDLPEAVDISPTKSPKFSPRATARRNRDKALSNIAERLDISTQGKTEEQISQEIIEKIENNKGKASITKAVER
jgi:TatA/E family protein of Tat protein translocase